MRAAVCRCGSSPSLRSPPPRVLRPPPLNARSRRTTLRSGDKGHDLLRGYSGGHCAGEVATTRAQSSGARTERSQRWAGLWVIWILRAAAGLICTFLLSGKVEISQRPPTLFFFRSWNCPTSPETQDAPAGPRCS